MTGDTMEANEPARAVERRRVPRVMWTAAALTCIACVISLYALCRYPQVFGAAGCLSTHWILTTHYAEFARSFTAGTEPDPRVDAMASAYRDWLREHLPAAGAHRLYFDHGTVELDSLYPRHQRAVDQIVAARGYRRDIDWVTREFAGAPHNEGAWRARLDIPLQFLLRR